MEKFLIYDKELSRPIKSFSAFVCNLFGLPILKVNTPGIT